MSSKNALFRLAQTMSLRRLGFTKKILLGSNTNLSDGIEEYIKLHADEIDNKSTILILVNGGVGFPVEPGLLR